MKETIADIQARYVWKPLLPSYSAPHAIVIDPIQQAYDQGWNACMAHLKVVGKI